MTYQEFMKRQKDQPENIGRSFTYGSCLYDFMKQGFTDTNAEYLIYDHIAYKLGINYEDVENLPYRAVIEIPDIAVYDEIARFLYLNNEENDETTN